MNHIIFLNKRGITLTELIVAGVIIGIVMVGAVSIDFAIRRARAMTSYDMLLAGKLEEAMLLVSREIGRTIGYNSATPLERGYTLYAVGPDGYVNCFRQDRNNTFADYSDDTWVCFQNASSINDVLRCEATEAEVNIGGLICDGHPTSELIFKIQGPIFLPDSYILDVYNAAGQLEYFEIRLHSTYFCTYENNCVAPVHPIENPELTLVTRISPPMLSR